MRKKALVTGGSRGIGKGIVECLAEEGYDVVFSYRSCKEEAEILSEELKEKYQGNFYCLGAALEGKGEGRILFDKAVKLLGGLDLLVNNAGITVFERIDGLNEEETEKLIRLDFVNYLNMMGYAASYMKEHKILGSIINITSSRAERAYPEDAVYGAIKAGINRAVQSAALDMAPYGIRINSVAPGAICIRTPEEIERYGQTELKGFWEQLGERIPLGRNGTPKDIGNAVTFLASEKASYITGVTLRVDGGLILPGMPERIDTDKNDWGGEQK